MINKNSRDAYESVKKNASETRIIICDFLKNNPGSTRQDIEEKTSLKINQVSGRVSDMIQEGVIFVNGDVTVNRKKRGKLFLSEQLH